VLTESDQGSPRDPPNERFSAGRYGIDLKRPRRGSASTAWAGRIAETARRGFAASSNSASSAAGLRSSPAATDLAHKFVAKAVRLRSYASDANTERDGSDRTATSFGDVYEETRVTPYTPDNRGERNDSSLHLSC